MPSTWSGARGVVLAVLCIASLFGILLLEVWSASYISVGALAVIPVGVSAWLLNARGAIGIVVFALIVRTVGVALGGIDVLTAVVETAVLVIVAVAIGQAGILFNRWRESEARLREQGERLAIVAERERIASEAYESALHSLIGTTLQLQSAATMIEEPAAKSRVTAAIDALDRIVIQVRQAILKPDRSKPQAPP